MKSTCITGILEAEAAYMMEFVIRFMDAKDNLVFLDIKTNRPVRAPGMLLKVLKNH